MEKIKIYWLLLLLFSVDSYAAEQLYKIELLIFSQNMPNTEIFEQTESKIAWPKRLLDRSAFKQVDPEYLRLGGSYAQLAKTQGYQPLIHVAWIQEVRANSLSTAVQINNAAAGVNGYFRIQRGNLLHMIADIEYSPNSFEDAVIYRLNEKRRFKLNETHYLDHPKFGILARVSLIPR